MVCKGICDRYESKSPSDSNRHRYELGQKWCTDCEIFLKWDKPNCPCCGNKLRTKPRHSRDRHRYQEIKMIQRI